ncbi:hypothetical protein [Chitinophaga rhizosphaerae]|uniref:hypothetical protein n=1 Tax=Chitinophaga rhizosphaerae TaxID=1864947 RepID=UPI000F7FE6CD|nr:hypothetical protein [Chitinophaga rhizosphaerae]
MQKFTDPPGHPFLPAPFGCNCLTNSPGKGVFDHPLRPDLILRTCRETEAAAGQRLYAFLPPPAPELTVR